MARVFPVFCLEEKNIHEGMVSYEHFLEPSDEARDQFDCIARSYHRNCTEMFSMLNAAFQHIGVIPWVIAAFEREYRISGHVLAQREHPNDVRLSGYSMKNGYSFQKDGPTPISLLLIRSKEVLEKLSETSPLFEQIWSAMASRAETGNWLCFPDPLPEEWVKQIEDEDEALLAKYIGN